MHLQTALPVQGELYSPLTTSREGKEILVAKQLLQLESCFHSNRFSNKNSTHQENVKNLK